MSNYHLLEDPEPTKAKRRQRRPRADKGEKKENFPPMRRSSEPFPRPQAVAYGSLRGSIGSSPSSGGGRMISRSYERNRVIEAFVPPREVLRKLSRHEPVLPQTEEIAKLLALVRKIRDMGFPKNKAFFAMVVTRANFPNLGGEAQVERAVDMILERDSDAWHPFKPSNVPVNVEAQMAASLSVVTTTEYDKCSICGRPERSHVLTIEAYEAAINDIEPSSNANSPDPRAPEALMRADTSTNYDFNILSDPLLESQLSAWGLAPSNPRLPESKSPEVTILPAGGDPGDDQKGPCVRTAGTCLICFDDKTEMEMGWSLCEHPFCVDCLREYYRHQVLDGEVLRVVCPHPECEREIQESELFAYLTPELVEKYHRFKEIRLVQLNKKARFCTKKGCPGWMTGSLFKSKLTCPICSTKHCWKCGNTWHGRFTRCDKGTDASFALWSLGKAVAKCPKCRARIWKDGGCNHMTCRYCKYEFCWICRGRYTYNHFEAWNLMGCPGAMNGPQCFRCPSCWPPIINRIIIILLLCICFVPAVIIGLAGMAAFAVLMIATLPLRCLYECFCGR